MPRIVLHTPEPSSAAARYVKELLLGLTASGVLVDVVCPDNFQFRSELEESPNIRTHFTSARSTRAGRGWIGRLGTNLLFLVSSCVRLIQVTRRGDIVHFQFPVHFPFGALFFLAAKLRGCKIVFTAHDPLPHKWLLPASMHWLERGTLKWAYEVSDIVIAHSEPGKRVLTDQFELNADKIAIVCHGPYVLGSVPMPMPTSKTLEILLFGALRENKGIDLAIQAVQEVHSRGVPVRLTIAGDVANIHQRAYWERCLNLIDSNPLPIRVIRDFIPDENLFELFGGCHCVMLPYTRFFSDSGVAFMALANARPILATRAGGLGPLMERTEMAIPIEHASVDSVTATILSAAHAGVEGLARMGRSGSEYVNTEFGWRKIGALTVKVYASCSKQAVQPRAGHSTKHAIIGRNS
jgi:glycogen synthase